MVTKMISVGLYWMVSLYLARSAENFFGLAFDVFLIHGRWGAGNLKSSWEQGRIGPLNSSRQWEGNFGFFKKGILHFVRRFFHVLRPSIVEI